MAMGYPRYFAHPRSPSPYTKKSLSELLSWDPYLHFSAVSVPYSAYFLTNSTQTTPGKRHHVLYAISHCQSPLTAGWVPSKLHRLYSFPHFNRKSIIIFRHYGSRSVRIYTCTLLKCVFWPKFYIKNPGQNNITQICVHLHVFCYTDQQMEPS